MKKEKIEQPKFIKTESTFKPAFFDLTCVDFYWLLVDKKYIPEILAAYEQFTI
jgi:hypothetical protein